MSDLEKIMKIAETEDRSLSGLVKLLIWESFGNKKQIKKAREILIPLREKYC